MVFQQRRCTSRTRSELYSHEAQRVLDSLQSTPSYSASGLRRALCPARLISHTSKYYEGSPGVERLLRMPSIAFVIGTPMGQAATQRLHVVQLVTSAGGFADLSRAFSELNAEGQAISQTPHLMRFSLKAFTHLYSSSPAPCIGRSHAQSTRWGGRS